MRLDAFEVHEPIPELHNTCVIAVLRPWINVGRVGTQILTKLKGHLDAKELGRLARPGNFYDFTRYRPRTRTVNDRRVLTIPNTIVHYAHDDESNRDYLFLEMREPHAKGEDYAEAVVNLLKQFDVTEYCGIGGMYDSVPHTRPLLVTGNLTKDQEARAGGLVSTRSGTYQGPTSIANLVSQAQANSEVITISLMARLPQYLQLEEDHMGAARLMEVLCTLYGFPVSLADSAGGEKQYQEISQTVESNKPEVKELIQELERYYDQNIVSMQSQEQSDVSLSPEVASFLDEMGERLDEGKETQ